MSFALLEQFVMHSVLDHLGREADSTAALKRQVLGELVALPLEAGYLRRRAHGYPRPQQSEVEWDEDEELVFPE